MRRSTTLSVIALVAGLLLTGAGCISFNSSNAQGPLGMFRSADKGETWQEKNTYPTPDGVKSLSGVRVFRLFTDPHDSDTIYMGTRGQGLFYTHDRGDNWEVVPDLSKAYIYALAVDPVNKCVMYVSNGGSILKTDDCTRTWKTVYTEQRGQRIVGIAIENSDHNIVYAGLFDGDVIRSSNGGASWRVVKSTGENIQHITTDPQVPGRIYVALARRGLLRSDDGGVNWTNLTEGLQNYSDALYFYRLILHPTKKDTLFWLSKYGILRSDDAGETWNELKLLSPPGSVNIYSFAVDPKDEKTMYYVGTVLNDKNVSRSTFYKSVDGGNNWVTKKMPTNQVPVTMIVHKTDPNVIFMGFTTPEN